MLLYIGRSLIGFFRIELISCMLEARKSRISGLLQILNKTDTHYRTDIQRFKWPNNIQHQNTNNQLKNLQQ